MTVLARPRHPLVEDALELARLWCTGHTIDGASALAHAAAVASTLGRYAPDHATPELVAACLLHDAPEYAGAELDQAVNATLGPAVLGLILALDSEHQTMASYHRDPAGALANLDRIATTQPAVFAASTADKIVSFGTILRRGEEAKNPAAYWQRRRAFLSHVPYFRAFADRAATVVPKPLADELERLVTRAEAAGR